MRQLERFKWWLIALVALVVLLFLFRDTALVRSLWNVVTAISETLARLQRR